MEGSPPRSPPKLRRKAPSQNDVYEEPPTTAQRLVDYFVVVTPKPRWNLEGNPVESRQGSGEEPGETGNIHIPQVRKDCAYQPTISARYPKKDYENNPLNPMIVQFCFPIDDVVLPSRDYIMPHVHHFVLTNERGRRMYGTCLTVFEETEPEGPWLRQTTMEPDSGGIELSDGKSGKNIYVPKVLCVISSWPYLTAFREYLAQLYRLATATNVMRIPIERYIVNLCKEIPAPPPGAYEVQTCILDSTIRFWAPPAKLPIAYVALPFHVLFESVDIDNVLAIWQAMLVERKILLVSSQHSILTVCAEILCSLLFPMRWSHLYVPLLPKLFGPMLDAPVPFLCGVCRENWMHFQQYLVNDDCVVVDLDHNTVKVGQNVAAMPPTPKKKWNKLRAALQDQIGGYFGRVHGSNVSNMKGKRVKGSPKSTTMWKERHGGFDFAFALAFTPDSPSLLCDRMPEPEQATWAHVQEAFHQFLVSSLKDYRNYLTPPPRPSFDVEDFLSDRKAVNVPFLSEMCMTQQFDAFLTRRLFSPGEPDLIFFDQTIDAKMNRSKLKLRKVDTPFLKSANAHKDLTKFAAVKPNETGLPTYMKFSYKDWPETLDKNCLSTPRSIPSMISAEFDRQACMVSKLKAEDSEDVFPETGAEFDTNPQVCAFTLFFFLYSAVVGLEWERHAARLKEEEKRQQERYIKETRDERDSREVSGCAPDSAQQLCSSLNVCSSAPLTSTLAYLGKEAEVSYRTIFDPAAGESNSLERLLADVEEAKGIANAQLSLAFDVLETARLRHLPVDEDSYFSLMEACGRSGSSEGALRLIKTMKSDGLNVHGEILVDFLAAFSHSEKSEVKMMSSPASVPSTTLLESQFEGLSISEKDISADCVTKASQEDDTTSVSGSSIGSSSSSSFRAEVSSLWNWFGGKSLNTNLAKRRRKRKSKNSDKHLKVTPMVGRQSSFGTGVLQSVYSDVVIDTSCDSCPQCSHRMSETDCVQGWKGGDFNDYKSRCPRCKHRFVTQFKVSCPSESFVGSQGTGTALHCEFLSPWVIRREMHVIVKAKPGIDTVLQRKWREGTPFNSTLFWNIVVLFKRYRLPMAFLFQGDFPNRLTLPPTPAEV